MFLLSCLPLSLFGQGQIVIDSVTAADALLIDHARVRGIRVGSSGGAGVYVQNAGTNGLEVGNAGFFGVLINNAESDGINVGSVGSDGLSVFHAEENGFKINRADGDGIHVESAGSDGIYVGDATGYSMNIRGSKISTTSIAGHIAQIYNYSSDTNQDVLALKAGISSNPGSGANFITFYDRGNRALGSIEGNGSGGVTFKSGSADFAEYLPINNNETKYESGDIIAIQNGSISLNTTGAQQLMVITEQPIILGNDQIDTDNYEKVSFVGQVPIKVRGPVQAGDWIISTGQHDGTGLARASDKIQIEDQIVGLALDSSIDPATKKINAIVGLDHSQALKDHILSDMQSTIKELKKEIEILKEMVLHKEE